MNIFLNRNSDILVYQVPNTMLKETHVMNPDGEKQAYNVEFNSDIYKHTQK